MNRAPRQDIVPYRSRDSLYSRSVVRGSQPWQNPDQEWRRLYQYEWPICLFLTVQFFVRKLCIFSSNLWCLDAPEGSRGYLM